MDNTWNAVPIHHRGAVIFGERWLAVNMLLVGLCRDHGIAVWEEPWRTLLPEIAWAWCQDITGTEAYSQQTHDP